MSSDTNVRCDRHRFDGPLRPADYVIDWSVPPHSPTLAGKLLAWVPLLFVGCVVAAWWWL